MEPTTEVKTEAPAKEEVKAESSDPIEDPDILQFQLKMSNTIKGMPAEVQERFMALKVLYVSGISSILSRMKPMNMMT